MHGVELAGLASSVAEAGEDFQRSAKHDVHLLVGAVSKINVFLLWIFGERDIPDRAVTQCSLRDEYLFHKSSIFLEDLNPVVHAIADVEQAVVREFGAMHGISELLGRGSIGVIGAEIGVIRLIAVSAPVPLVFAGIGVIHDNAMVAVAIGDIHFVRVLIDKDFCRKPEILDIITAFTGGDFTNLHHELTVLGKLHDHTVVEVTQSSRGLALVRSCTLPAACAASSGPARGHAAAITADPHVTFVIDGDAMVRVRPFVPLSLAAPVADQISGLIVFENWRRRQTA